MRTIAAWARRDRRGFSLLELLVVVGLVCTLMGCLVLAHASSHRQSLSLDFQAAAMQSVEILMVRIQEDFDSLVPGPLDRTFAEPSPAPGVSLGVVSPGSGPRGVPLDGSELVLTDRVTYRFDPSTRTVLRNDVPVRAGPFESVRFTFVPSRPGDPTPPFGDTLTVHVTIAPTDGPRTPVREDRKLAFDLTVHSPQGTVNHVWETWVGDR